MKPVPDLLFPGEGNSATLHPALPAPIDPQAPVKGRSKGVEARRLKFWAARRTFSYVERRRMRANAAGSPFSTAWAC